MIVNVETTVDRPVTEVFDAMADARNEPEWNSMVSECVLLTEEPIGLGTRFRTVNRGRPYEATLTAYDRPHSLTFDVVGSAMEIEGSITFAESGAGTVMNATFDMRPKGFMKVMLPLMAGAVRKDFPKQLAGFKAFCETAPAP